MRASRFRLNAAVTPARVVVGALERRRVLAQVDADQERAARPGVARHPAQQRDRLGRVEVADRRAGKNTTRRARRGSPSGSAHGRGEVRDDGPHASRGNWRTSAAAAPRSAVARDVHRHVGRRAARARRAAARVLRALPAPYSTSERARADARGDLARRGARGCRARCASGSTRAARRCARTAPSRARRRTTWAAAACAAPRARRARRRRNCADSSAEPSDLDARFLEADHASLASRMPRELPARVGGEEVAVGRADVAARRGARAAAQHHLVAHELAVVLAERARERPEAGVGA